MNLVLYLVAVLIWGTTWIAIRWQVGIAAPAVSIAFRFWLAALAMFVLMRIGRRPMRVPRAAWPLLFGQGVTLFCVNFLCFYRAEQVVPSGLVAVVFSTAPLFNAVLGRVLLGRALRPGAIAGALLGLAGMACLFAREWARHAGGGAMWTGLAIALAGTVSFSLGNLLSSRIQALGLGPMLTNSWAMLVGASLLTLGSLAAGLSFQPEWTPRYFGALAYLALPGSVVGFTAYLTLVGRVGADRAAYCTVLFPFVALAVSTLFEGYRWSVGAVLGLVFVVAGNLVAFDLHRHLPRLLGSRGVARG